jgi:hypothetical protein
MSSSEEKKGCFLNQFFLVHNNFTDCLKVLKLESLFHQKVAKKEPIRCKTPKKRL